MRAKIKIWGNSLALRIPKHLADETGLKPNSQVEVRVERGTLIVEPVATPVYQLDDLLAQITPDNLHSEIDTGDAVGNETW
jgi:antitoxin MazE